MTPSTLQINTPAWAEPLLGPSRFKAAYGGRGGGKSHFFAELMIDEHIRDRSQSSVCIREVQNSLKQSVKKLVELKIKALDVGYYFDVQDSMIKSHNGDGVIIFQGMQNHTADAIKSLEGFKRAWVEEGQSLSQRSVDLLIPTIREDDSEIWIGWNPDKPTDPVDALMRGDDPPPGSTIVNVNYWDNPWFPEVLRAGMEYDKRRDLDKYLHIWRGEYEKNSQARVFHNWKEEEFEAPADAMFRFGCDWGFANDPTTLVRGYLVGKTLYIDHEAYRIGCDIIDTPDLFMTVPQAEKWPIIADSARPETISHMRKHGFPKMMAAVKGPKSIHEGVEWLKGYDIIVHPRCTHTIDELGHYSYKVDKDTGAVLPLLEDKKNQIIDPLRYMTESLRRAANGQKVTKVNVQPRANHW